MTKEQIIERVVEILSENSPLSSIQSGYDAGEIYFDDHKAWKILTEKLEIEE